MPCNTTFSKFYYVYVLESVKDGKKYTGFTSDLRKRIEEHNNGASFSTKCRRPFKLIYYEACLLKEDAKRREHYLKTTQGHRFLGLRLIEYGRTKAAIHTES